MKLQAKRSVFRSRIGDDGLGIGGPLPCGKHLKRGPKPRERHSRAVEIPGRLESLNLASAMLFGVLSRMLSKKQSSNDSLPKEQP